MNEYDFEVDEKKLLKTLEKLDEEAKFGNPDVDDAVDLVTEKTSIDKADSSKIINELIDERIIITGDSDAIELVKIEEIPNKSENRSKRPNNLMQDNIFEFNGCAIGLNVPSKVEIDEKIYEKFRDYENRFGYEHEFNVYKWKRGVGHRINFLFTHPEQRVEVGENNLYIRPVEDMSDWDLDRRGIAVLSDVVDLDEGIDDTDPSFFSQRSYELVSQANREDVMELLENIDDGELKELIDMYLTGADSVELDTKLLYTLRPYLLRYNPKVIESEEAMPLNPHALIYTNPAVGKSTTFDKIGKKFDYCKPAKVLGWSSADKSEKGDLDGLTQAFGIDEINENDNESEFLTRGFLPIMRNGSYKASQGQGVETETWAPLVFMSNPKDQEETELIFKFRNNLSNLSANYGALGSRIGVIMYGENYQTVKNLTGDKEKGQKAGKVVKTIIDIAAHHFSELIQKKDVEEWLNQEFPQEYVDFIEERNNHDIAVSEVKKFWSEHLKAYKHARGHALRNAVIDHLPEIVHEVHEVHDILESADQHFERLLDINKESLKQICTTIDVEVVRKMKEDALYELDPKYLRLFTYSILEKADNPEDYNRFKPLSTIRDTFLNEKENFPEEVKGNYRKFAVIEDNISNGDKNKRENLESKIGIKIEEIEGETMWKISNPQKFKEYQEIY